MHRYRTKGPRIVLGEPLPSKDEPTSPIPKNIVAEALKVHNFLSADQSRGYRHAAIEFGVTKARISQLLKILKALSPEFITYMSNCQERETLRKFSGKKLLRISGLKSAANKTKKLAGISNGSHLQESRPDLDLTAV